MIAIPELTPVIIPVLEPIVATAVLLLNQVPPAVSVRVAEEPVQILPAPIIEDEVELIVAVTVATEPQPVE
jgi:hypothetical protein